MKFLRVPCQSPVRSLASSSLLPQCRYRVARFPPPPATSVTVTEVTGSPVCVPGLLSQVPLKCRAQN